MRYAMKKEYIEPRTEAVSIHNAAQPLCASINSLSPLEEKNELGGFDWNYK